MEGDQPPRAYDLEQLSCRCSATTRLAATWTSCRAQPTEVRGLVRRRLARTTGVPSHVCTPTPTPPLEMTLATVVRGTATRYFRNRIATRGVRECGAPLGRSVQPD